MPISIRPMTKKDCQPFIALEPRVFPDELSWDEDSFKYFFEPGLCFVAYDEETKEMKGYVFAAFLKNENKVNINNLGVAPESQHKHVGTRLMETIIRTAQVLHQNADFLSLQVKKDNTKAKALYKKFDFELIGDSETQEGYEDMSRRLHQEHKKEVSVIQTEKLGITIKVNTNYKQTYEHNLGFFSDKKTRSTPRHIDSSYSTNSFR